MVEDQTIADLPEDVIAEILVRLPVRPLLRFRCVSKPWCSLIRNPNFITKHHRFCSPHSSDSSSNYRGNQILVTHDLTISLLSGENLEPRQQLDFPYPDSFAIDGYCDGIVCASIAFKHFILWNPATREYKLLPPSCIPEGEWGCDYSVGFGFHSQSNDYKVVRILQFFVPKDPNNHKAGICKTESSNRVEVYSLKSDDWREIQPLSALVAPVSYLFPDRCINGCLFWTGLKRESNGVDHMLILFDMANELFQVIDSPVAPSINHNFTKLNKSSVAFIHLTGHELDIWAMSIPGEAGSCWVKQFSINLSLPPFRELCDPICLIPLGFLETGELLIDQVAPHPMVYSYYPFTQELENLVQFPLAHRQFMSYSETLISLHGENVLNLVREPFFSYPYFEEDEDEGFIKNYRAYNRSP